MIRFSPYLNRTNPYLFVGPKTPRISTVSYGWTTNYYGYTMYYLSSVTNLLWNDTI